MEILIFFKFIDSFLDSFLHFLCWKEELFNYSYIKFVLSF